MATKRTGRPQGRPKGSVDPTTRMLGGPLDRIKAVVCRDVLRSVIAGDDVAIAALQRDHPADLRVAQVMWLSALRARADYRFIPVLRAIEERMWGRVKYELEHSGPEGTPLGPTTYVCRLAGGTVAFTSEDAIPQQPSGRKP